MVNGMLVKPAESFLNLVREVVEMSNITKVTQ